MDITISKDVKSSHYEGYGIHIEKMTSSEFDAIRILLKEMVENDKRFSSVENSQLDLKYVVSMLNSKV